MSEYLYSLCRRCWWAEGLCYSPKLGASPNGLPITGDHFAACQRTGAFQGKQETLEQVIPREKLVNNFGAQTTVTRTFEMKQGHVLDALKHYDADLLIDRLEKELMNEIEG